MLDINNLQKFQSLTIDDVVTAIRQLTDKPCISDSMLTHLLRTASMYLLFFTELCNHSLSLGTVPDIFEATNVTSLLMKTNLDLTYVKLHRPISNMSVLSKLLECIIA